MVSTSSSCSPAGNAKISSTVCAAQPVSGNQTWPEANMSVTAFKRAILSCPLPGLKSCTNMPERRISSISGWPLALASTITLSGCHSTYCSWAIALSSGNSYLPLTLLSRITFWVLSSSLNQTPHVWQTEKSERSLVVSAVSKACTMNSTLGGLSPFHHLIQSRLTIAASAAVGFCWYWAYHCHMMWCIDARVCCRLSIVHCSGQIDFSLSVPSFRMAGNSNAS